MRCGEVSEKNSTGAQNRTTMLPAGMGGLGAAAGLMELAKTMTAQMAQ
jgi:hypothetical protein